MTSTRDEKHVICSLECLKDLNARSGGKDTSHKKKKKKKETTLSVEGKGEVKVMPDRVRVTLVILREATLTSQVNQALIEASDALIKLLQKDTQGRAQKLQTLNLTIEEVREKSKEQKENEERGLPNYGENQGKIIAYKGRFPISFEAEIANAGPVIALALKDNYASTVQDVRYIVSDTVSKPAYKEALRLATLDAEEKAGIVLNTLGLKRKAVIHITIEDTQFGRSNSEESESYSSFRAKAMMAPTMQLIGGESEINANITLLLSYE